MEKLTVSTPRGEETLYQATLDAVVEHLAAILIPMTESFSALPTTLCAECGQSRSCRS